MICVLFFGGSNFMAIGILGEYIGRILEQVKGRPLYIVKEAAGFGRADAKTRRRRRTAPLR